MKMPAKSSTINVPIKTRWTIIFGQQVVSPINMMPRHNPKSRDNITVSMELRIELFTVNFGSLHMWSATAWSLAIQKAPSRLTTPWVLYWLPPKVTHFWMLSCEHWRGSPVLGQLDTQYRPDERSLGFAK